MSDIFDALANARIALSYLKRMAVEAKDKPLADRLSAQSDALKERIRVLRGRDQLAWVDGALGLTEKFTAAEGRLQGILLEIEKDESNMDKVVKAAAVVDDLLALLEKV